MLSYNVFFFFFFIPQMFIFHNVTITYPANFTQCTTRGSFVTHWQETAYNMFTFSCLFLLPLVIMIICYTRIFIQISKRMTKRGCKFTADSAVGLVRTYMSGSGNCFMLTHPIFPLISVSLSSSVLGRATSPLLNEQHPQSSNENSENEHRHSDLLHSLLDSVLPAGFVVLVLSRRPGGEGLPLPHPHPVHLWAFQHLPGSHHLRPVRHTLPQGAEKLLPQSRGDVRNQICCRGFAL